MSGELAKALAKVMGNVGRVPKNGYNSYSKYHYATESDVLDHIRPLLSGEGVAVFFNCTEVEYLENCIVRVKAEIVLVHGESGDSMTMTSFGESRDADRSGKRQDKGLYQAMTGAMKYWAFKTFLISTGDDPETDRGNQPAQQAPAQQQQKSVRRMPQKTPKLTELVQALVQRCQQEEIPLGEIADKHGLPRKPSEYSQAQYKQLSKAVDEYIPPAQPDYQGDIVSADAA